MKKLFSFCFLSIFLWAQSQYLVIGKDSISLNKFKKDNQYGLENSGIEKTLNSVIDFTLMQQFAQELKIDTMSVFQQRMYDKDKELRDKYFFPSEVINPVLQNYLNASKTERKVLIFFAQKKKDEVKDYQKIYNDVKSGKVSMEDAIKQHTSASGTSFYLKPGVLDNVIDLELQNMSAGSYSSLINNDNVAVFAKLISTRPSIGYLVFGTLSFPNDANAEKVKAGIAEEFKQGKKFEQVSKIYGSTEDEKNRGGIVMGSPTLPDEVYNAIKNLKPGEHTAPILLNNKYFIFNVYSITPYEVTPKTEKFFKEEMMDSQYRDLLYDKLVEYLRKTSNYKESPDFAFIKKSYQNFQNYKKNDAVMYQFNNHKFTFADIKKDINEKIPNIDASIIKIWNEVMNQKNQTDLVTAYSGDFPNMNPVKQELTEFKKNVFADYIFSYWIQDQYKKHPEYITDYYEKNKSKYMWGNRAKGRVAIITDLSALKDIEKQIKNPKNWEALKKNYYGKLNDKKQIVVNFEEGEMPENADVFTKHGVPFKKGNYTVNMGERTLVIAVDEILPPTQMTLEEAKEDLKDAVTEKILNDLVNSQKAKTKIIIDPAFKTDLEQNFKK